MSDQTHDSPSDAASDASEPSMEDILASIRRIIAEDDAEEAANDSPIVETVQTDDSNDDIGDSLLELSAELVIDDDFEAEDLSIPEIEFVEEASIDTREISAADMDADLDLAIDDLVLDVPIAEDAELVEDDEVLEIVDLVFENSNEPEAVASVEDAEDDLNVLNVLDLTLDSQEPAIELTADNDEADDLVLSTSDGLTISDGILEDDNNTSLEIENSEDDLLSEFLDEIETSSDETAPEPIVEDIQGFDALELDDDKSDETEVEKINLSNDIEQAMLGDVISNDEVSSVAETARDDAESDIDLVKSLMADLTDNSFLEDDEATDFDVDFVKDDAAKFEDALDAAHDEQEAVLDDILELAMDDEVATTQIIDDPLVVSDLVEAEEAIPEISVADPLFEDAPDKGSSVLLDIAAAAEADAEWVQVQYKERRDQEDIDNSADEAETISDEIFDNLIEDVDDNIDIQTEDEVLAELEDTILESGLSDDLFEVQEETPEMPKAASADTILDEVTETAASDAFASLNQAVEEKVAVKEAGPPIGDLVQEALKPMLKEWLDENLKDIVERAVQKEVKRISSRK